MEKMKADVPDMTTRMSCQEIRPNVKTADEKLPEG